MTRLSIAMATYNGAPYLRKQLDSLARQTRLPDELVVTDDCSTDETQELIEEFAATAPFAVRFESNSERLGYSRNFERAARLCTGDLISFCDQDDSWYPDKLATVAELFAREPAVQLVVNDQDIAVDDLRPSGATTLGNIRKLGYDEGYLNSGCCMTLRRSPLDLLVPFPTGVAHDHWCGHLASLLGIKRIIEQPLQLFRRHGRNTSNDVLAQASPTLLSVVRKYGLRDASTGWRQERQSYCAYQERLTERRELAEAISSREQVNRAIASLQAKIDWIDKRLDLAELPRRRRAAPVISLWRAGFYDRHFGWKSALKDLIRP